MKRKRLEEMTAAMFDRHAIEECRSGSTVGHLKAAAAAVIDGAHAVSGREAWALLWRILAHEINALESGSQRPDISRFDADQIKAGQAFAYHLAVLLASDPRDYAGEIYMDKRFANAKLGQVFTPTCAAGFIVTSVAERIKEKNGGKLPTGVNHPWFDPCCGSGAFPLAVIRHTRREGIPPVYVAMNDVDPLCADMCFVQFSYAGGLGEMHTGDFLRMPSRKESGEAVTLADLPPLTHMTPWNMTLAAYFRDKEARRDD